MILELLVYQQAYRKLIILAEPAKSPYHGIALKVLSNSKLLGIADIGFEILSTGGNVMRLANIAFGVLAASNILALVVISHSWNNLIKPDFKSIAYNKVFRPPYRDLAHDLCKTPYLPRNHRLLSGLRPSVAAAVSIQKSSGRLSDAIGTGSSGAGAGSAGSSTDPASGAKPGRPGRRPSSSTSSTEGPGGAAERG